MDSDWWGNDDIKTGNKDAEVEGTKWIIKERSEWVLSAIFEGDNGENDIEGSEDGDGIESWW